MNPYFFGYGSLVNRNTHAYPDPQPAQLQGWRRRWVRTRLREVVFLTVEPDPDCAIDGLIAAVPNADWAALDLRETGYDRQISGGAVAHRLASSPQIAHYCVTSENRVDGGDHCILRSYLDVVVQGFLREFGDKGVQRFFDTTSGWETPILDDRVAPIYPRHQPITDGETALVDLHLSRLSARLK